MKELVRYLLENMYLDFQGEISLDTVRQFLRTDDSREARQLLQKLIEDKGVDELLLTLADCLKDHLRSGVNEEVVREQLAALLGELIAAILLVSAAWILSGCDQGTQRDEPVGRHGINRRSRSTSSAPTSGRTSRCRRTARIELAFDRLLLPACITRQTFVLTNAGGSMSYTPTIAYDPVARIVTSAPSLQRLRDRPSCRARRTTSSLLAVPQNAARRERTSGDRRGHRCRSPRESLPVSVTDPTPTAQPTVAIDFCRDIYPISSLKCAVSICHGPGVNGNIPAAGLLSILRVESRPPPSAGSPGIEHGPAVPRKHPDVALRRRPPIIDATGNSAGNPGNSWLMYKVLLAVPSPEPEDAGTPDATTSEEAGSPDATVGASDAGSNADGASASDGGTTDDGAAPAGTGDAGAGDAGAMEAGAAPPPRVVPSVDVAGIYGSLAFKALSDANARPSAVHPGSRDALPARPDRRAPHVQTDPLTLDEMERMSLWIAQGASAPAGCP